MNNREKPEFAALITETMAYHRQDTSNFVLGLWWSAFKSFELEQIIKALNTHATDPDLGRFPPKVADIVRILVGTQTDRATLAWGKVLMAISAVGAYQDVVFDDAAIHAAVADLGGWSKVCRTDLKELGYLQHRFCESHKAYTGRKVFDYPRQLSGDRSPDDDYAKRGLPPPKPAVVGDLRAAERVLRGGSTATSGITFQRVGQLMLGAHIQQFEAGHQGVVA